MTTALHIVCPHCDAVNRVPAARLADRGTCGVCRKPLFDGRPLALSEKRFDNHISRNDIPVLVDFWAPWCGPCRGMAPVFERAASELEPNMRLVKVDIEAAPNVAARLRISTIPTMIVFRAGGEIARISGAQQLQQLTRWVGEVIGGVSAQRS